MTGNSGFDLNLSGKAGMSFLDSTDRIIMLADTTGSIFYANKNAAAGHGGKENLLGKTCYKILLGHDRPTGICESCRIGDGCPACSSTFERRMDSPPPADVHPLGDSTSGFKGIMIVMERTTGTAPVEEKLLYLKGIIHDLNNLLACVSMNIEVACVRCPKNESDLKKVLDESLHAARQTCLLVKNLASFTRTQEIRRIPQELKETDVGHVVREASDLVFRNTRIAFSIESKCDQAQCMGDELQLSQLFYNLLMNAKDAVSVTDGKVCTRFSNTVLAPGNAEGLVPGRYLRIEVANNGPAISDGNMEKLFTPYFTTKSGGSGLGLSICAWIVKGHNGAISARSEPSRETVFTVLLPVP